MTDKHGSDELKWPSRGKTQIAHNACSDVAKWTAEGFTALANKEKERILRDLLRIDSESDRPADYLVVVG